MKKEQARVASSSLRLLQLFAKNGRLKELVEERDVDGHNATYWAKQFGMKECLQFLKEVFESEPKFFTGADILAQMAAAKDAKPKKGGKKKAAGGKKKK